jgi:hypothetical protein
VLLKPVFTLIILTQFDDSVCYIDGGVKAWQEAKRRMI